MKKKELIEKLDKFDDEAEVYFVRINLEAKKGKYCDISDVSEVEFKFDRDAATGKQCNVLRMIKHKEK